MRINDNGAGTAQRDTVRAWRGERPALSAERVAEVRRRILDGSYHSADVARRVAQRMLERGDLY